MVIAGSEIVCCIVLSVKDAIASYLLLKSVSLTNCSIYSICVSVFKTDYIISLKFGTYFLMYREVGNTCLDFEASIVEFSDTHKFIFKVKESNPVRWDSDTLVSRKRRHIGQALLLPTHQVP